MTFRFLLILNFLLLSESLAAPGVTYDQRQEGKVNVQVDIKDVQIVALVDSDTLEDYMNYDYSYDYSDFTIKPSSRPTTSKPSTTEEIVRPTTPISTDHFNTSSESSNDSSTKLPESSSSSSTPINTTEVNEALKLNSTTIASTTNDEKIKVSLNSTTDPTKIEDQKQEHTSENTMSSDIKPDGTKKPAGIAEPRKRCPMGFHLKSGRCFKRRLSLISPRQALLKLAPTLLSKAQLLGRQAATGS